ncbi:MAG: hypothetical protein OCC49_12805 [Fibrobacterales bacterium]
MNLIIFILFISFTFLSAKTDTTFFSNGKIESIIHFDQNNQENGTSLFWNAHGTLIHKRELKNGKTNGVFANYYDTGKTSREEHYTMGKLDGWSISWDEQSHTKDSTLYIDGNRVEEFLFYPSTKQINSHTLFVHKNSYSYITMQDRFLKSGEILSQIRSGNGIEKYKRNNETKLRNVKLFKGGKKEGKSIRDKSHPLFNLNPLPKKDILPWDIEKYGHLKN